MKKSLAKMFVCASREREVKSFFIFWIKIEFSLENALKANNVFRFISHTDGERLKNLCAELKT